MHCQTWNKTGEFLLSYENWHGRTYLTVFDDYKIDGNSIIIPPKFISFCKFITLDFSINWIIRSLYYIFPRFDQ